MGRSRAQDDHVRRTDGDTSVADCRIRFLAASMALWRALDHPGDLEVVAHALNAFDETAAEFDGCT